MKKVALYSNKRQLDSHTGFVVASESKQHYRSMLYNVAYHTFSIQVHEKIVGSQGLTQWGFPPTTVPLLTGNLTLVLWLGGSTPSGLDDLKRPQIDKRLATASGNK